MDKKPKGLDDPGTVKFMKVMAAVNVWLFRRTGGRLGSPRTTPLVYLRDGANVVVVASQAGRPENPLWFGNVQANPEVTVQIARDRVPMRARVADPAERSVLWPKLVALYADYDSYQSWTDRVIPVVVLEPR